MSMAFEKRKCNIQFTAPDQVVVTNMFYQKYFTLKDNCVVDLYKLTKMNVENIEQLSQKAKIPFPFFVCFMKNEQDNRFFGMVVIKSGKTKLEILQEEEDIVSLDNNNKTYSVSCYVED